MEKEQQLKDMIRSCFVYGGADKDSWHFERFISPYKKHFTEEEFERIYTSYLQELKDNYTIKHGVYTDSEGCTYNELVGKNTLDIATHGVSKGY